MTSGTLNVTVPSAAVPEVVELATPPDKSVTSFSILPREGRLWLLATLVMFLTGLFKGINLLVLLAYLLGGIWLLNRQLVRWSLKRLSGKRAAPGPVFAGETIERTIELTITGNRLVRGVVVIDRGDAHDSRWLALALNPQLPMRIRLRQTFPARGRYRCEPLRAYSSFPFGLTARGRQLSAGEEWIVLPRIGRIHLESMKHWLARMLQGDGRMRRRQLLPAAHEADIHGLRDYRAGDSPRWIHWRTSARRNQLLVREFEDRSNPNLVLVVEPFLPQSPGESDRDALECTISLAATIVRDWCRDPLQRLTLVIAGESPAVFSNGAGSDFARQGLQALALEPGQATTNRVTWLNDVRRLIRNSPVLVVTTSPDSALANLTSVDLGRPVAAIHPAALPPWYDVPAGSGRA